MAPNLAWPKTFYNLAHSVIIVLDALVMKKILGLEMDSSIRSRCGSRAVYCPEARPESSGKRKFFGVASRLDACLINSSWVPERSVTTGSPCFQTCPALPEIPVFAIAAAQLRKPPLPGEGQEILIDKVTEGEVRSRRWKKDLFRQPDDGLLSACLLKDHPGSLQVAGAHCRDWILG
jgi:hypothetical protein